VVVAAVGFRRVYVDVDDEDDDVSLGWSGTSPATETPLNLAMPPDDDGWDDDLS